MRKGEKCLDILIELIGCTAFAMLIIFTMGNVFANWTVGKRYPQMDEIGQSFFVWVTYVGMGMLYKNGEQIHIDFLVNLLPEKWRRVSNIFTDFITMFISGIMLYLSWTLAVKSMNKMTSVMKIPFFFIDFALVIGFFTMIIYIILKFAENVGKGGKKDG